MQWVDIVDEHTVCFVMSAPWPLLPVMLPYQEIVSKAFAAKVGDEGLLTKVDGAGPTSARRDNTASVAPRAKPATRPSTSPTAVEMPTTANSGLASATSFSP